MKLVKNILTKLLAVSFVISLMAATTVSVYAQPSPIQGEGVSQDVIDSFNPLKMAQSPYATDFSTPAGIVNRLLLFAFPIAGMILFIMIVWGGFEMLTGAASKKSLDAGRQRITAAIIGFIILFSSFWFAQILEAVFNIRIL